MRRLFRWWLLPVVVGLWVLFWTAVLWDRPVRPSPEADSVIYFTVVDLVTKTILLWLPLGLTILGSILFGLRNRSIRNGAGLLLVTLFVVFTVYWFSPEVFGWPNPNSPFITQGCYEYKGRQVVLPNVGDVQSIRGAGRVYRLLRYDYASCINGMLPINNYNVYICDFFGISCDVIFRYEIEADMGAIYVDLSNKPYLEIEDQTLNVFIAGRKVFSHPVD